MAAPPKVLDKQIASTGHMERLPDGTYDYVIDRPGMTREEILEHFARKCEHGYNRRGLIRAIIFEAYREAQNGYERDPKNVRGFWYERLLGTIRTVMRDRGDQETIDVTINHAWGDLIEGGYATYAGMNITSAKSGNYHMAVTKNSPYPRAILLVEKEDHFEPLHDIADCYGITFVATGGQNSRCAAMEFAEKLEKAGIDTTEPFTIYSFCDFDPEGWSIPDTFIDHLSLKIEAPINLIRLGVLRDQITENVIRLRGAPYSPETKSESAEKGVVTKYERFVEEAGGCYLPDTGEPARIELDLFENDQIRDLILEQLAQHLDGFEYQKRDLKSYIVKSYRRGYWTPEGDPEGEADTLYDPYFEAIEETYSKLEAEKSKRAPEARQRIRELKRTMWRKINEQEEIIEDETSDLTWQQNALERLQRELARERDEEVDIVKRNPRVEPPTFESVKEAFEHIESNGGWRQFMEGLDIDVLDGEAVADAARNHRRGFSWDAYDYSDRINDWIRENLVGDQQYGSPEPPSKPPWRLIEEALCSV